MGRHKSSGHTEMKYTLKREVPSISDYINIRLAAGLSRKSENAARIGLANSLYSVVVYDGGTPIGLGRVIGDGGCFFEVTDIAVLPQHQKKGIGDMIMNSIMEFLREQAPETAYVSLMADHGTPHFYKRYGFSFAEMPKASGMYLRI
jgi:ribosomal protein S18 acetylase RimI-like enzyme